MNNHHPETTLEEKVHMLAGLVRILAIKMAKDHPEGEGTAALMEAAAELDYTYVKPGWKLWPKRIWSAAKATAMAPTDLRGLVLNLDRWLKDHMSFAQSCIAVLLQEELSDKGTPLVEALREQFPNLRSVAGPLRLPLIGALRLAARLRALGYPFVDGFFAGIVDEAAVVKETVTDDQKVRAEVKRRAEYRQRASTEQA